MTRTLPSWSDGPTRDAIIAFAASVSSGPDAVPEAERVAVFDNDGTLWTEKPMPTQLHFIVQQWKAAVDADPSLADRQPYRAAATGDLAWLGGAIDKHYAGDDSDLHAMVGAILASTAGESVDDYEAQVAMFYRDAQHLTLHRPYRFAIYQPMIELLRFLESHGFTCYIVSGGDRDFMRPMTVEYYGIPPERVVGSAVGLTYDDDARAVRYGSTFDFMDDGPEKPIRIWSRIGRRPLLAAGNSNGDVPMLRYVQGHPRSLSLLIHHDDDGGRGDAPYDKGAEQALAAASDHGFTVVSVKRDWSTVFPEA
ncbi:HAD family hydrolase [Agromyces mariniharenae]|uniref:Haloacid dehalogenase-like hydrolase n=1 Tax=Agromyces mariniharenae TaxID=2604423 RepID=A0A5S4V262_9MICO|nr:HAD family hydrolase [Agromyces mariniharenae]TYL53227.1 haloacid dehalogenase-like hydrolase [Agromyces mariniharenae]